MQLFSVKILIETVFNDGAFKDLTASSKRAQAIKLH